MSDRIAVMSAGRLQQLGAARDIYERPQNRFVADFIGETNLLAATITAMKDQRATCALPNGMEVECDAIEPGSQGQAVHLSIRPERIHLTDADHGHWQGVVRENIFVGTDVQTVVALPDDMTLIVRTQNSAHGAQSMFDSGTKVGIVIDDNAVRMLED